MRKNDDEDTDEVRATRPTLLADDDDDFVVVNAALAAATAAAPLSWSVLAVVTSGIPQRPDTERDAVRLKVLHLGGRGAHQASGSGGRVTLL